MLQRSCHFSFHADVAAQIWGNALASAYNWLKWHSGTKMRDRQTEYIVNQFTISMPVCKQQCTLLKHTFFYKHCDPSLQQHWYRTITDGTKSWLLVASFTSMSPVFHITCCGKFIQLPTWLTLRQCPCTISWKTVVLHIVLQWQLDTWVW
jgi:hypothetical protein